MHSEERTHFRGEGSPLSDAGPSGRSLSHSARKLLGRNVSRLGNAGRPVPGGAAKRRLAVPTIIPQFAAVRRSSFEFDGAGNFQAVPWSRIAELGPAMGGSSPDAGSPPVGAKGPIDPLRPTLPPSPPLTSPLIHSRSKDRLPDGAREASTVKPGRFLWFHLVIPRTCSSISVAARQAISYLHPPLPLQHVVALLANGPFCSLLDGALLFRINSPGPLDSPYSFKIAVRMTRNSIVSLALGDVPRLELSKGARSTGPASLLLSFSNIFPANPNVGGISPLTDGSLGPNMELILPHSAIGIHDVGPAVGSFAQSEAATWGSTGAAALADTAVAQLGVNGGYAAVTPIRHTPSMSSQYGLGFSSELPRNPEVSGAFPGLRKRSSSPALPTEDLSLGTGTWPSPPPPPPPASLDPSGPDHISLLQATASATWHPETGSSAAEGTNGALGNAPLGPAEFVIDDQDLEDLLMGVHPEGADSPVPCSSLELLVHVVEAHVEQLLDTVVELEMRLDLLERQLETDTDKKKDLLKDRLFPRMHLDLQRLLQALSHCEVALPRLQDRLLARRWCTTDEAGAFDALMARLRRTKESMGFLASRITALQAGLDQWQAEQINMKLYYLSFLSMVFLPISFITGLFGMNVGGVPWVPQTTNDPRIVRGFWNVVWMCVAMVLFTVIGIITGPTVVGAITSLLASKSKQPMRQVVRRTFLVCVKKARSLLGPVLECLGYRISWLTSDRGGD